MEKKVLLKEVQELLSDSKFREVYDKLLPMWEDGSLQQLSDTQETNIENDLCFSFARAGRFVSEFDTSKEAFGHLIKQANEKGNYERSFRTNPFYGDVLRVSGDVEGARAFLNRAIIKQEKLVSQGKMDKDSLSVGSTFLELSKTLGEEELHEKSEMLDIAEENLKQYLQQEPKPPLYPRRFLHTIQEQRVPGLLSQGKDKEAADLYKELIGNADKDPRMAHEKYSSMLGLASLNIERNVELEEARDYAAQAHDFYKDNYPGTLWQATYYELKASKGLGGEFKDHKDLVEREKEEWQSYAFKDSQTVEMRSNLSILINKERLNILDKDERV